MDEQYGDVERKGGDEVKGIGATAGAVNMRRRRHCDVFSSNHTKEPSRFRWKVDRVSGGMSVKNNNGTQI